MAPRVFVGEMAGTVGTLAQPEKGIGTQKRMFEILELGVPTIAWHVARDNQAEFISTLAICAGNQKKSVHCGHKEKMRMLTIDFVLVLCYHKLTFKVNLAVRYLIVIYRNKSIERICTDYSEATRKHGSDIADKLYQRIYEFLPPQASKL